MAGSKPYGSEAMRMSELRRWVHRMEDAEGATAVEIIEQASGKIVLEATDANGCVVETLEVKA